MSVAYCANMAAGVGPGSRKTSSTPASDSQCECMPPPSRSMSMKVSVGLNQKAAPVCEAVCETRKGMVPYSAMGLSSSYSKTSSVYMR